VSSQHADSQTILLVDDDQYFRQIQSCILSQGGFNIVEAQDPAAATVALGEHKPVLIVVAYQLQGMDGVSWIEQTRQSGIDIPMVFVTSATLDKKVMQHLTKKLNVPLILRKPINMTTFLQEVQSVLQGPTPSPTPSSVAAMMRESNINNLDFGIGDRKSTAPAPAGPPEQSLLSSIASELQFELNQAKIEYLRFTFAELDEFLNRNKSFDIRDKATFEAVKRLAHKIRGTAGTFGLVKISRLAENIEDCLAQGHEKTVDLNVSVGWLLDDLRSAVQQVAQDCDIASNPST
jgi:CheY-like chemotaxis protein/HPt (histidine-containing phosphotransfer) domain-containing protein